MIYQYQQPARCVYLLGAEDHGLPEKELNQCHEIVKLPGEYSMNVSVVGSIIIYDRLLKQSI